MISNPDIQKEIEDLKQLTAVLEADEHYSISASSRKSWSTISFRRSPKQIQEYSKIETALALNKLTDDKLLRLEKILVERLHQCRKKLAEFSLDESSNERTENRFSYKNCGKPYFKDKDGFQPPDNEDTILMKKSGMYDFSNIASVPGWTVKDKSDFMTLLLKMSRDIKIKELNSKIAHFQRQSKTKKVNYEKEILAVKREISKVAKKSLKDLALPIDQDYDWDTISNQLNRRHVAHEYCALWRLFLHPSINKDAWSKTEHSELQKIAINYNMQDWDGIARDLNTKRTAYQCFVYFRTNMSNTFTNQKWSKEEEEYLKRLIEYYREEDYIPWGRVAASMENRTKIQIYNKYMRLEELRKGRFLKEEDAVILNCVEKYGADFKKIKSFLPGRSAVQLRNRYQALNKTRISTVWTLAEDKKLIQLLSNQDTVTNYSSVSKFLPGKDRVHIRARYITLMKWMHRNPNVDLIHAPRRPARRLGHGKAADNLSNAIEQLKDRMQSEVDYKKSKRITKDTREEDIDDAILAFMVTENIKESENPRSGNDELCVVHENFTFSVRSWNSTNLQKILLLLKANLVKDVFKETALYHTYPELVVPEQEVSLVKVKSYSRKNLVSTVKVDKPPDIWGEKTLSAIQFVLPPHFATITGCKALIAHATSKPSTKLDINSLKKKNLVFKQQLDILMERFYVLFLWPLLLSNEVPRKKKSKKKPFIVSLPSISVLDTANPRKLRKCLAFEDSDDEIDLNDLK